jgi:hypothetical protein
MPWTVFDYRDERGCNAVKAWLESLQKPELTRLNKRIDLLQQIGDELCPGLAGPLKESRHLYKIRINGDVAARLLLCKGPVNMGAEYTLLYGVVERDYKLPFGAIEKAERFREQIIANSKDRRCKHERPAR